MARLDSVGGEGSHARVRLVRSGVCKTGIRIFRLEEGDQAECGQCTMAAVLVGAPAERGDLTPLTQGFKRLVEDYADTSDLVSDDGFFVCFPEPE